MVKALGSVVYHCDRGAYGLLAELPPDRLRRSLHPGLASLLEYEDGKIDSLVSTLEAFLDHAGDVKRTAEQLHLHRGSMYYRLRRIQAITGTDLGD
jgi:DNA-binding PucR family transcriptional regulator